MTESPLAPPPMSRPTVWERKQYLATAPFVRMLDEPWAGACSRTLRNKDRKCRIAAIFEVQPIGGEWTMYCWEHAVTALEATPEDYDRLHKWFDKHPPDWRTDGNRSS